MPPKSRAVAGPPPPPLTAHPSATLCDSISMVGTYPIHIGANSFLHPRCKLNSAVGPINIGQCCIINERTQLLSPDENGMVIGDGVVVEINAVVMAGRIGDGCSIEVGSRLGKGSVIGDNCMIGPLTEIAENEELEENTVTYGNEQRRVDKSDSAELRRRATEQQIGCLKKLLPNRAENKKPIFGEVFTDIPAGVYLAKKNKNCNAVGAVRTAYGTLPLDGYPSVQRQTPSM